MTKTLTHVTESQYRLKEAVLDEAKREFKCVIITEGLGNLRDKNYYTKEALQSIVELSQTSKVKAIPCFMNHQDGFEAQNLPEGDMNRLIGYHYPLELGSIKNETGEDVAAVYSTLHLADNTTGNDAMGYIKLALETSKAIPDTYLMGISIDANAESEPGETPSGMQVNYVRAFSEVNSFDMVTRPARGGKFLESDRKAFAKSGDELIRKIAKMIESFVGGTDKNDTKDAVKNKLTIKNNIKNEVTPEGYEKVVKALKSKSDVTNPWAVAWWMKGQGYSPSEAEAMIGQSEQLNEAISSTNLQVLTIPKGSVKEKIKAKLGKNLAAKINS